ncbi:unnamed protein product [Lasius platythorax]|uniref:Uncharacterized protein n=1 Tax=Lasius platythorax TaxID=488582 RepID=A0AAV2NUL3_9HYME
MKSVVSAEPLAMIPANITSMEEVVEVPEASQALELPESSQESTQEQAQPDGTTENGGNNPEVTERDNPTAESNSGVEKNAGDKEEQNQAPPVTLKYSV